MIGKDISIPEIGRGIADDTCRACVYKALSPQISYDLDRGFSALHVNFIHGVVWSVEFWTGCVDQHVGLYGLEDSPHRFEVGKVSYIVRDTVKPDKEIGRDRQNVGVCSHVLRKAGGSGWQVRRSHQL